MVISGWAASSPVTISANRSRSTASAAPAGTRLASAARITSDPRRRISSLSRPTALSSLSPRKELLQHQLGEPVGLVNRGRPRRPHLVQRHRHAARGRLPGGFRTREAPADDANHVSGTLASGGLAPGGWLGLDGRFAGIDRRLRSGRLPSRTGTPWTGCALRIGRPAGGPRAAARPGGASIRPRASSSVSPAGIGASGHRGVDRSVGHVRTVSPFEHLQRRGAVGRLDLTDDAPRRAAAAPLLLRRREQRQRAVADRR